MLLRSAIICGFILSFIGCATTHEGEVAQSNDQNIVLSVQKSSGLSDKYYYFYEYTIENKSSNWKTVQIVDVNFEGNNSEILTDDKLSAWIEGAELKLKKEQYNQDVLLASMAAVGGIVAATSNNPGVQTGGVAVMGAAVGATVGTNIARAKNQASSGRKGVGGTVNVPQTHIFVPSKIAPESYIKRWVVIKAPAKPSSNQSSANVQDVNAGDRWDGRVGKRSFYIEQKLISKVKVDEQEPKDFIAEVKTYSRYDD